MRSGRISTNHDREVQERENGVCPEWKIKEEQPEGNKGEEVIPDKSNEI